MPMPSKNGRRALPRPWRPRTVTVIPTLFFLTVVIILLVVMQQAPDTSPEPQLPTTPTPTLSPWIRYQTLKGYFLQDDPKTNAKTFDYVRRTIAAPSLNTRPFPYKSALTKPRRQTATNFGLIERPYDSDSSIPEEERHNLTQWQRFENELQSLNKHAAVGVSYRLLFVGRHGEGYHNVAERFYGTPAWDCHWSTLDGNSTTTWSDAHLTPTGISQALAASSFFSSQIHTQHLPTIQSHYVSPLSRALHTAQLTFASLPSPFHPIVKELLREAIGIHTCDRRSSRSYIASNYPPYYSIEPGFTEEDELWRPDLRESTSALTARLGELLDDVLGHDESMVVSLTSHGGAIGGILRVLGHRPFSVKTGAVMPVLVKVEVVREERKPEVHVEPWKPKPECT